MLAHYTILQEIFDKDLAKGAYADGTIPLGTTVVYIINNRIFTFTAQCLH